VLVNNAGAGAIFPPADVTADRIMKIFAVNVLGPSLLAAAALPYSAVAKGTIVNVSSTFGPGSIHREGSVGVVSRSLPAYPLEGNAGN
jgi:NAD(P)-dependent dehydrogenase (short-subunit alcohol dehydrogenase family)